MSKARKGAVSVRLFCIYSGDGASWNPGDVVAVEADEAERLLGLGAAEIVAEAATAKDAATE